jgi:cell division septation protein DedD
MNAMTNVDGARDFERDEYSPDDPDLEAYEYDEEESGVRMPLMLIFGVVAIAVAVGAYFFGNSSGYEAGMKAGQEAAVRTIGGGPLGTRVRPEDPGGQPAPAERDVFTSLSGDDPAGGEIVLPREEPIVELPGAGVSPDGPVPDSTTIASADTAPVVPGPTVPAPSGGSDDGVIAVPPPPSTLRPGATSSDTSTTSRPVTFPDEQPPAPANPTATSGGRYVVQVASLPSRSAVDQTWSRLRARYPDLLGSTTQDVEVADLGERGIYHRLRVGYYQQRSEAVTLCQTLKSRGQDCLVRTR